MVSSGGSGVSEKAVLPGEKTQLCVCAEQQKQTSPMGVGCLIGLCVQEPLLSVLGPDMRWVPAPASSTAPPCNTSVHCAEGATLGVNAEARCRGTAGAGRTGFPEEGPGAVEVAEDLGQFGIHDFLLSVPGLHPDLEQKLLLQEQDAVIVKNMKSELVRLPKVERELKQLREENAYLR